MPEHDRGCLLGRQFGESGSQVAILNQHVRIRSDSGPADAPDDLPYLAQALLALVRGGLINCDAVNPRFGSSNRPPAPPFPISSPQCILGAVLGGATATQHRAQ